MIWVFFFEVLEQKKSSSRVVIVEKGTKRPGRKEGRYVDMGKKCLLYIERMVEGPGVNLKGISRQNMS